MDEQNIDIDICSFEKDTPCTKKKRAAHRPPNINIISQGMRACLSAFYPILIAFSYGTSHLENFTNLR